MDLNKLRSDIKAYAIEIMGETSTSGGAGAYLTKLKEDPKIHNRTVKKQDINSPTGFESAPNPNMYTKTMKFKIVKPKERLNSKDLWNESTDGDKKIECTSCGWSWKLSEGGDDPYTCHKCGHVNSPLNEARYSQFKKQTLKRTPREQLHKAVKEIQMKMDEVNKLVDFTSKMKQELKENEEELNYLKRTKNSLHKIQEKIQYISNKIKTITE